MSKRTRPYLRYIDLQAMQAFERSETEFPSQPTAVQAPFLEQFTSDWTSRWTVSQAMKQTPVGDETMSYVGKWSVEEPEVAKGIEGDEGLVMS